jgi:glc operon protein GlcG
MLLATHVRPRLLLGTGIALILLAGAFLLGRAGQTAHAQATTPITVAERAITLDAANTMIAAATARARELGVAVSVVVVDGHGLQKAMVRMDGARVTSANVAYAKANTAAVRQETSESYGRGLADNSLLLHSAIAAQPNIFLTPGGLPIIVDGQVVGAIGAGGGSGPQDLEIATAGLAAIQ